MKCPYCHHTFTLTWPRYLKGFWGRYPCPSCLKVSRTRFRWFTFFIMLAVGLVGLVPAVLLLVLWWAPGWGLLAFLPTLAVLMLMDKLFENRVHELKPLEPEPPSDTAACAECGRVLKVGDMVAHGGRHVCARCKPVFLQKLAEGATTGPAARRGSALKWLNRLLLWLLVLAVLGVLLVLLLRVVHVTFTIASP